MLTMPKGTCALVHPYAGGNPATYNVQTLAKGNGEVIVDIRYGWEEWDGVSAFPDCGPSTLYRVRVTNTGQQTWYCRVPRARVEGTRLLTITPGYVQTWTGTALANRGITTLEDIEEISLSLTPPPA